MKRFALFASIVLALALVVSFVPGCTAEQTDQLRIQRQNIEDVRVATTQAVADLSVEIALLPPDDPVRKATEAKISKLNVALNKINEYLPKIDAAIAAASTGDITGAGVRDAVKDIPYGGLALIVIGLGTGIWQTFQKNKVKKELVAESKALEQTVKGIDAAMPQKPEPMKAALDSAQDADTKVRVAEIRAS